MTPQRVEEIKSFLKQADGMADKGVAESKNTLRKPATGDKAELGRKLIEEARTRRSSDEIRELILAGADVNSLDEDGRTALMHVSGCDTKATLVLLEHGADVNMADRMGRTALMEAAWWSNEETVRALLDADANVNAQDGFGNTALMEASWNDRYKASSGADSENRRDSVVKMLLDEGADAGMKNSRGLAALDFDPNESTRKLLEEAMKGK